MTPAEIIRAHAQKQKLDPSRLAGQVQNFLDQPKTKALAEGDCIFLIKNVNGTAFVYILNGGSASGYLRALETGLNALRKMGFKKAAMRVADQAKSERIAKSVGAKRVFYKEVESKQDPYLMTMEL